MSTSRRALLTAAATAAGTALLPTGAAQAGAGVRPPRRFGSPLAPQRTPVATPRTPPATAPGAAGLDPLHLVRRTTFGLTPELLAEASKNPAGWLEQQLNPTRIDDSACDAIVQRFRFYAMDPPQLHKELNFGNWDGMIDTVRASFARACWSKRQLLEVMVEFWSNHLNTTAPSSEVWSGKGMDDRTVIRPHALGRFGDMLVASAMSPAMLSYLDGRNSQGSNPNENYGREVLELHTVGINAGYGQEGVVDCARALTGLTVWTPWNGGTAANLGMFRYRADWHHVGPVKVLGWSAPNGDRNGGVAVATSLLRYLALHPATARRIATKLCLRFVSDTPPPALVDKLTAVYLANGSAIVPVLRALFASPEFASSAGQKQKRPYEDVLSTVRMLGIQASTDGKVKGIGDLVWGLHELGQAPFGWHPPDGYPDVAPAWTGTGTTLMRWNLHVGLTQGWWKDGLVYPGASLFDRLLPGRSFATRAELVTAVATRLLPGTTLAPAHRDALVTFLGGPGKVEQWDRDGIFNILVALLLDSPAWSTR